MKNILLFSAAVMAVIAMLYAGYEGLLQNQSYGSFFTFIGAITTVGLGIDVVSHLRIRIRKSNVRKLNGF